MATEVIDCSFCAEYCSYEELLNVLGLCPNKDALADLLLENGISREEAMRLLQAAEGEAPPEAADAMAKRAHNLRRAVCRKLKALGIGAPEGHDSLLRLLDGLPVETKRDVARGLLEEDGGDLWEIRTVPGSDFVASVKEHHELKSLALVKLIPFLRRRLSEWGLALTNRQVRDFFGGSPNVSVPWCAAEILRSVNGEFEKGLVPLEELVGAEEPDEWLERARRKLLFRSHSSMHKAIAEATSLKYDCVHKALSGREKAKRIQAEIVYCLERWLREQEEGLELDVHDDYRGVPVEWTCALLPQLEPQFDSKEAIYRAISEQTGIKAGSVRRYFQSNGQLKCAPLQVYRVASRMVEGADDLPGRRGSYLQSDATRRVAYRLAGRTRAALKRWRRDRQALELEMEFKELRRELIVVMKEQRTALPDSVSAN